METGRNILNENIRVLLVEDSHTDAELIQLTLFGEMDNLEFRRVYSDPDLRRSLIEFDPQIIISDYSMPGFSGLEALSICRVQKPEVPFIFVSGTIGEERAVEALKNGANDYVLKDSLSRLPHAVRQSILIQRDQRFKKRQQEELARTYELLNSIFDTTHMMVAYMDTDFNFIQVNRSFGEMNNHPPPYFVGKNFFSLFPDDERRKLFEHVSRTGKAYFKYMDDSFDDRDDGSNQLSRSFDWSVAPTKSYGMTEGLVFTCVDITERISLRDERDELLRTLEERVAQRTRELEEANEQLANFKKDITDSITYAKRIQDAFIPNRTATDMHVLEAFVYDLPRDILSGDFHWSHHSELSNCTYVVIADCTGHGVPGSLMTLLGVQFLEQAIVGQPDKRSPGEVLSEIDQGIIRFLGQEDASKQMNDGMEMVLLRIDHDDRRLFCANAGRPVYIYSNNELTRYGSLKNAVGGLLRGKEKNFVDFEFNYKSGDCLYAYSDGAVDQFGGVSGQKFMRKRLEVMLKAIQAHPFEKHGQLIAEEFQAWKGDLEQVDDVIFLGIKF